MGTQTTCLENLSALEIAQDYEARLHPTTEGRKKWTLMGRILARTQRIEQARKALKDNQFTCLQGLKGLIQYIAEGQFDNFEEEVKLFIALLEEDILNAHSIEDCEELPFVDAAPFEHELAEAKEIFEKYFKYKP